MLAAVRSLSRKLGSKRGQIAARWRRWSLILNGEARHYILSHIFLLASFLSDSIWVPNAPLSSYGISWMHLFVAIVSRAALFHLLNKHNGPNTSEVFNSSHVILNMI
jgi:hypothetical protein